MIFIDILLKYILPVIFSSFMSLAAALLILYIFRIKDSSIRILFLFLPLIRPLIVLFEKVKVDKVSQDTHILGLRFPDYTNMFKVFDSNINIFSDLNYLTVFIILLAIGITLIIRWIHLFFFYRKLAFEEKVGKKDLPYVYSVIEKYCKKIKIREPEVSLTHHSYFSPFIIGVKKTILVLSPKLLDLLSEGEKETLIQHELSHIKRKDNLIGWIALILRDILFFNPFSYIAYFLIKAEQEKGSDKLLVKYSGKPNKKIASDILNIIKKIKLIAGNKYLNSPAQCYRFSPRLKIKMEQIKSRIKLILNTNVGRIKSKLFPKIVMFILWFFALMIQLIIVLKLGDKVIYFR